MAENFVNILREIRGNTLAPATDKNCIYGDIKWMYGVISGYRQITPEERLKLANIEEEATKNSSDAFLLSRANHTGTMSMAYTTDSNSRFAMTINDKNKLDGMIPDATKNDTDANLRNRATHTGVQSIDTLFDSSTHVKMTSDERSKLTAIQTNATKNATDVQLRDRSTHTGVQSADTIVDGFTNAAFTNAEKTKLAALDITKPPAHLHHMNEITLGSLGASRIAESSAQQFVSSAEKDRISGSEQSVNKGIPNGYAPLDGNGKINPSYLDSLNVIDVFTPVDFDAMLLLSSAKPGDIAYAQDSQSTYMLIGLPSNNPLNWKELNSTVSVISINGLTGAVSMSTDDLPEGTVNKYFKGDRVADEVKDFIKAGTNVTVSYNSITNELTISADAYSKEELDSGQLDNRYYTEIELNSGVLDSRYFTETELLDGALDTRYYTESEIDTKLAWHNDASGISYDGTSSGLVATKVQDAVDEIKGSVDILDSTVVKLTGDQTIEDVKTFMSSPIVPTPTAVNQAVNKQYVDNMVISSNGYAVAMAIVFGS